MTMNDQYETGNSSVEISDGTKGSVVTVKVYAKAIEPDAEVEASYRRIRHIIDATGQSELSEDLELIGKHIGHLRSQIPDIPAAAKLVKATHLELAAGVERDGGVITYDPDRKLLAAWEEMEEHDREAGA